MRTNGISDILYGLRFSVQTQCKDVHALYQFDIANDPRRIENKLGVLLTELLNQRAVQLLL